ncbi:hypothetical protein DEIPH_ctg045orf0008 [Deinococcus phoenicis]|uniref:Uncharacterized protein n=1 Tax=Deinococcus phoenicis TaxID=1476583 RepID=A0A016QNC0_9DEIO|nr:hypothetical protein [Deinococcus phoenicis]EYB67279.1 hypothetical protein DEIPH_ctg045orf0008 [Deinococcus phoenicis]
MNTLAPTPITRTYATVTYDGWGDSLSATVRTEATITLHGHRDGEGRGTVTSATVNGQAVAPELAVRLLNRAERVGTVTLLGECVEPVMPTDGPAIGNRAAWTLHRELGRLGHRNHYAVAGEALGRDVGSLAALTGVEAVTVRSYAYGQFGMVG